MLMTYFFFLADSIHKSKLLITSFIFAIGKRNQKCGHKLNFQEFRFLN